MLTVADKIRYKVTGDTPSEDGILLWDQAGSQPVVSVAGEFIPLILKDGHGVVFSSTDITPAAINTAYVVDWDGISLESGLAIGTTTSHLEFSKGGTYLMSFSVQITSTSSSQKNLWFWPKINGTDVAGSTMKVTITNSSDTIVSSRTALFDITAGDYLEVAYAADSTAVTLDAIAATAFAPATPSVILSVTRIHQ